MDNQSATQQIGYLVLKDDGAILESGGELQNDERTGSLIMGLLQTTESIDEIFMPANSCERVSIVFDEYTLNICLCNRRIYVMKVRNTPGMRSNNAVYDESDTTAALMT